MPVLPALPWRSVCVCALELTSCGRACVHSACTCVSAAQRPWTPILVRAVRVWERESASARRILDGASSALRPAAAFPCECVCVRVCVCVARPAVLCALVYGVVCGLSHSLVDPFSSRPLRSLLRSLSVPNRSRWRSASQAAHTLLGYPTQKGLPFSSTDLAPLPPLPHLSSTPCDDRPQHPQCCLPHRRYSSSSMATLTPTRPRASPRSAAPCCRAATRRGTARRARRHAPQALSHTLRRPAPHATERQELLAGGRGRPRP